jgi:hypothetical protein
LRSFARYRPLPLSSLSSSAKAAGVNARTKAFSNNGRSVRFFMG